MIGFEHALAIVLLVVGILLLVVLQSHGQGPRRVRSLSSRGGTPGPRLAIGPHVVRRGGYRPTLGGDRSVRADDQASNR